MVSVCQLHPEAYPRLGHVFFYARSKADLHHEGELPKHLFESFIAKDQQVKVRL